MVCCAGFPAMVMVQVSILTPRSQLRNPELCVFRELSSYFSLFSSVCQNKLLWKTNRWFFSERQASWKSEKQEEGEFSLSVYAIVRRRKNLQTFFHFTSFGEISTLLEAFWKNSMAQLPSCKSSSPSPIENAAAFTFLNSVKIEKKKTAKTTGNLETLIKESL